MMASTAPAAGLADPVLDSQHVYRAILSAFAQPGRISQVDRLETAPPPLAPATAAAGLTLFDLATPVWIAPDIITDAAAGFFSFHTGCPMTDDPGTAAFAIISGMDGASLARDFSAGTPEYPDRSATLIVQVAALTEGHGRRLTGPGIESEHRLDVTGVSPAFWDLVGANHARFPLGLDFILVAGGRLACLPRTTKVES